MLLVKSKKYLDEIGKPVSELPEKYRDIFASMEEFETEYRQVPAGERAPFEAFILETDEDVFKSTKVDFGKPKSNSEIIANRLTDEASLAALDAHLKTLPQTKDLHFKDGEYTAGRKAVHKKILDDIKSGNQCITRSKPIAILTGGLPGSGKSRFIKQNANWLTNPAIFKIDADDVRAKLPEYEGWNAAQTHEETSDLVKMLLSEITAKPNCRYDLVYDGTMTNYKKYFQLLNQLKKAGYQIFLVYLQVDLETSVSRALDRYKRNGRYVPVDVIRDIAAKGTGDFEALKKEADGWVLINGNTAEVLKTGGLELPKNRDYTKLTELGCEDCTHDPSKFTPGDRAIYKSKSGFKLGTVIEFDHHVKYGESGFDIYSFHEDGAKEAKEANESRLLKIGDNTDDPEALRGEIAWEAWNTKTKGFLSKLYEHGMKAAKDLAGAGRKRSLTFGQFEFQILMLEDAVLWKLVDANAPEIVKVPNPKTKGKTIVDKTNGRILGHEAPENRIKGDELPAGSKKQSLLSGAKSLRTAAKYAEETKATSLQAAAKAMETAAKYLT